ncbi:MAG: glutamate racemase [Actinobacteria bacterium]|nr:MAG: glutamate racemase [Actinomycetota bacterium]
MNNNPIGIFDSGIGGLTVVKEIIKLLPDEDLIYFGDAARFPYGTKTKDQLKIYVSQISNYLVSQDVKLIVIACNSASTVLGIAQEELDIPVIGVIEPGARAAVLETVNRKVGVIGTEATINSDLYKQAIEVFDAGVGVFSQATPEFAGFVEEGTLDGQDIKSSVSNYLLPLKDKGIDTLILGCTHYPLLSSLIQEVMGQDINLISSAEETAKEVKEVLQRKEHLKTNGEPNYRFICSDGQDKFLSLGSRFLGRQIGQVERIKL